MGLLQTSVILAPNTRANQPAAGDVPKGALYCVTDEGNLLERNSGTAWETFSPLGSDFMQKHVAVWQSSFVSGTPQDAMFGAGSSFALTEAGTQSAVIADGNLFINYASAASAGNLTGARPAQLLLARPDLNPDFQIICRTPSDLTEVRLWIGWISAANTNSDTLADQGAAFRYSTVAGDAGWTPVTRDGTTQNVGTAIGGALVADTVQRLRIRTVDGGVTWLFSVDGSAEQSVTTNVPASTEAMAWDLRVIPVIASARNIGLCRAQVAFGAQV